MSAPRLIAALLLAASVGCSGIEPPSAVTERGRRFSPSDANHSVSSATVVTLPYNFDIDTPHAMYNHDILGIGRTGLVTGRAYSPAADGYNAFRWSPSAGVEDLGTLPGPDNFSAGYAINSSGEVTGASLDQISFGDDYASLHAMRVSLPWVPSKSCPGACGMIDLGGPHPPMIVSAGYAINDAGQIAGDLGGIAQLWSATNVRTPLGTLGGSTSSGRAINFRAAVAGWSTLTNGQTHAFIKTADGPMRDLGTLGGTTSSAVGMNDFYQVIGSSTLTSGASHAFVWTSNGGMKDLGVLPGGTSSAATGINHAGAIIGWSTVAGGAKHAFLWTQSDGMEDITPATGITDPVGLSDNYKTAQGYKIYTLAF